MSLPTIKRKNKKTEEKLNCELVKELNEKQKSGENKIMKANIGIRMTQVGINVCSQVRNLPLFCV
jgi:hypothetical protein